MGWLVAVVNTPAKVVKLGLYIPMSKVTGKLLLIRNFDSLPPPLTIEQEALALTAATVLVPVALTVVKLPAAGVVAPTVPLMLIEAVPVRFVTVPLDGVPNTGVTITIEVLVQALILPLATVPSAGVTNVGLVNRLVTDSCFVVLVVA